MPCSRQIFTWGNFHSVLKCVHPIGLFCSKKMQESLSSTNFVVFIDDPDINKSFGEFLLQVQGGLLSGSKKEGMSASRAGVLLSSNSPEISRCVL